MKKHKFKAGDLVRRKNRVGSSRPDRLGVIVKKAESQLLPRWMKIQRLPIWHVVWNHGIGEIIMEQQLIHIKEIEDTCS